MAKIYKTSSGAKIVMLKNGRTRTYTKNSKGKYTYTGGCGTQNRRKK